MVGVVIGAHRAPHGQHGVELAPIRKRLVLVQLDRHGLHSLLAHDLREDARGLAGDVLKDQ
jgi:hypothetical protein